MVEILKDKRDLKSLQLEDNDLGVEGRWKKDTGTGMVLGEAGKKFLFAWWWVETSRSGDM